MRDILGITDLKSGAAKTPPFPVRVRIHPLFAERRLFNQLFHESATQVSVREDMRPFFRFLKTTIYMGHGITGRIKEISKAVVKQLMNTLRMAFMAILVVAAILALSYWFEDPLKRAVFLLGGASVILYVIIKILAVKSYGDEE